MRLFKLEFFFSRYLPKSGITELYDNSMFSSLRNVHTVSIVAAQISIPTDSVGGFRRRAFDSTIKNDSFFFFCRLWGIAPWLCNLDFRVLLLGFAI